MSKLSIYENSWLDLVFEGKNKAYGAYQLRRQSERTTILSFFLGLLFIASLAALLLNTFREKVTPLSIPRIEDYVVHLTILPPNKPAPKKLIVPVSKKQHNNENKQLVNPTVVNPDDANQNIAKGTDNSSKTSPAEGTETGTTTPSGGNGITTETPTDSRAIVNTTLALDKLPEFPGGIDKFYKYVGNNFRNPDSEESKTLRVYVAFVIEKDGSMTDIQVKRDPGFGLGAEAIRVLKSLKTKWSPGMIAGKPVRTAYNLPITVQVK